jgi:hypothetical protein
LLASLRPDLHPDDALAFPTEAGTMIDPSNARRALARLIRRHVPGLQVKRITPHSFRHTFASLHLARGTNLLWVQKQGGWQSPHVLLTTYAHFLPTEIIGYADAIMTPTTAPDGPIRPWPEHAHVASKRAPARNGAASRGSVVSAPGLEPGTGGLREDEDPEE